jgi:hypothetical protein
MHDVEFAPLTGAPVRLESVATVAARAAMVLEEARGQVLTVGAGLEAQRSGAVTAGRQLLADVGARLGTCAAVLAGASAALREHAGVLAEQQHAALLAVARRSEALDRERRALADADEARRSTWNGVLPDPVGAALRLAAAERAAADARTDALAAEDRWRRARDAKAAASARAATVLGVLGDVRVVIAGAAAGRSVSQVAASWQEGLHAAVLASTAAAPRERDRHSARAELRRILSEASGDPAFWTAFWGETTPEELYRALGLGPVDDALAASLATGVRAWAVTAAPEVLEAFGREVVEGLGGSDLGLDGRAALAALLLAPTVPGAVHRAAADALAERRASRPYDPVDLVWTEPVTTAVATGLLHHPRDAFEHLAPADPGLAAERAHAWFGIAPPDGWPDGGASVAGALAAAVAVGSGSPSRSDQARAALLVSHATHELPRGLLGGPVPPSDLASTRIAGAYEPYLPVFGDVVLSSDEGAPPRPPDVLDDFTLAEGVVRDLPVVVQPDLDAFGLRDVISATSRTEASGAAWLGTADRYHDAMLDLAFGSAAPEGIEEGDQNNVVGASLRDAGAVAGALQTATIRAAEREQAAIDGAASAAMFLGSVAVAKVPVSPVVSTSATTAAGTALDGFLPDRLEPARDAVLANEVAFRERFAGATVDAAVQHDVDRGSSTQEALARRAELAPDADSVTTSFKATYDAMSDLRRTLGENS